MIGRNLASESSRLRFAAALAASSCPAAATPVRTLTASAAGANECESASPPAPPSWRDRILGSQHARVAKEAEQSLPECGRNRHRGAKTLCKLRAVSIFFSFTANSPGTLVWCICCHLRVARQGLFSGEEKKKRRTQFSGRNTTETSIPRDGNDAAKDCSSHKGNEHESKDNKMGRNTKLDKKRYIFNRSVFS
jgi:hypothetical protein